MKFFKSSLVGISLFVSMSASANSWTEALKIVQNIQSLNEPKQELRYQNKNPAVNNSPKENCMENVKIGMPSQNSKTNIFVCHEGYAAMFNTQYKVPIWVAEQLKSDEIFGSGERQVKFTQDSAINSRFQASKKDYSRSGWDQGHMAAAANFSQNQYLMDESFYYTNIVPQNPDHNRKFWAELEKKVRFWTSHRKELYVITGPVFNSNQPRTIGNGVAVPDQIFKIVFDPRTNNALAILSPNISLTNKDLPLYIVPVSDVERATGLNFFSNLPKDIQEQIKNRRSGMWTR